MLYFTVFWGTRRLKRSIVLFVFSALRCSDSTAVDVAPPVSRRRPRHRIPRNKNNNIDRPAESPGARVQTPLAANTR